MNSHKRPFFGFTQQYPLPGLCILHVLPADAFLGTKSLPERGAVPAQRREVSACAEASDITSREAGLPGAGSEIHMPRF